MAFSVPHAPLAILVQLASSVCLTTILQLLVLWSATPARLSTSTATNAAMEQFARSVLLASLLLYVILVLWATQAQVVRSAMLDSSPTTELVILVRSSAITAIPAIMELLAVLVQLDIKALLVNPVQLDITTLQPLTTLLPAVLVPSSMWAADNATQAQFVRSVQ